MELDIEYIILNPDRDFNGLRITAQNLPKNHFCMIASNSDQKEVKKLKTICPIYTGKDTITSLINAGMKKVTKTLGFYIVCWQSS